MRKYLAGTLAALGVAAVLAVGCSEATKETSKGTEGNKSASQTSANLSGKIQIDGSTTVYPISMAVAEEFTNANPNVNVTVGQAGTGGGFKRFDKGEIEISDASRTIKADEAAAAKKSGVEYVEIPVALDGITIAVNKDNTWAKDITVEELKKIWEPGSTVKTWKDVRSDWPDEKITLYGPTTDNGTFDYFTKEINGEEKACRTDYNASTDSNVRVEGVMGDKGALGYFGYAYYAENKAKLKALAVTNKGETVAPSEETILSGSYKPLSRKIYIYVNKKALERPEVKAFVEYYLNDGRNLVKPSGYVPLNDSEYEASLKLVK